MYVCLYFRPHRADDLKRCVVVPVCVAKTSIPAKPPKHQKRRDLETFFILDSRRVSPLAPGTYRAGMHNTSQITLFGAMLCLLSDIAPIRSWTWTLRPPDVRHRHLPYHTIPPTFSMIAPPRLLENDTPPPLQKGGAKNKEGNAVRLHVFSRR